MNFCDKVHAQCALSYHDKCILAAVTPRDVWKAVLIDQGIEEYLLEQLEKETTEEDFVEVAFKGFQKWSQQYSNKASRCRVKEALKKLGRDDIIEALPWKIPEDENDVRGNAVFNIIHHKPGVCQKKRHQNTYRKKSRLK